MFLMKVFGYDENFWQIEGTGILINANDFSIKEEAEKVAQAVMQKIHDKKIDAESTMERKFFLQSRSSSGYILIRPNDGEPFYVFVLATREGVMPFSIALPLKNRQKIRTNNQDDIADFCLFNPKIRLSRSYKPQR